MPQAAATWAYGALATYGTAAAYVGAAVAYVGTAVAITYGVQAIMATTGPGGNSAIMGGARVQAGSVAGGAALSTSVPVSDSPRRVVYGRVKVGGVPVYVTQSDSGRYVDMAIAICEGPITAINSTIWIGEELSSASKFSGLVSVNRYLGEPGQTHSAALASVSRGEWTSAMDGTGVAWAHVQYEFDRNAFSRGLIFPAFDVTGCRLFDPRPGLENGRVDNPALVLLHFIRSRWAFENRLIDDDIDFTAFAAAASVCDEIVTSVDTANSVGGVAGRVYRYSFNGVFEATGNPAAFVEAVCQAMAGHLINDGVQVRAYAGAYRPPTGPTLTAEYLRAAPTWRTHPGGQQRYNIARGTYREPRQGWEMTDYHEQRLGAGIIAAEGEVVSQMDLPGVINGAQAQRLARVQMMTARSAVPLSLQCNYGVFQWQLFDVVAVNLPEVGAVGNYLIVQYDWATEEDGGIDITLVPHLASDYAWDPATMEQTVQPLSVPTFRSIPATITSLTLTGEEVYAEASNPVRTMTAAWTATDWVMLNFYEVRFRKAGDEFETYQTTDLFLIVENVLKDTVYQVQVRAVGVDGRTGPWTDVVDGELAPDTTGPAAPTGLVVTGTFTHQVKFVTPADLDLRYVQVGTVSGPGLGSYVPIWESYARPSSIMSVPLNYPPGTHYAAVGIDLSGNLGTMAYAGEGTGDPGEYYAPQFDAISAELSDLDNRVTGLEGP